jgi:ABC-2 type transport system permease protein
VHIGVSLAMALFFLALCIGIVGWIFKTGYRLKN